MRGRLLFTPLLLACSMRLAAQAAAPSTTLENFPKLGVAEPPRVRLDPAVLRPTTFKRVINVKSCGEWQRAMDAARSGEAIDVAPGLACAQTLVLKPKDNCEQRIAIRTAGREYTPGQRLRPSQVERAPLARIEAPKDLSQAIVAAPGANCWWLESLEITAAPNVNNINYLVILGTREVTPMDSTISDIHIVGSWIHGRPELPLTRCVALNHQVGIIEDNWIDDCHAKGADSQAILAYNGGGPYRIVNNHLGGAGECILFGGADPNRVGLVPSDIEIRGNYCYTPPSWLGKWTIKNLFELKAVRRIWVEGNVFDGCMVDGQIGLAWVIKSANQSGRCPQCSTSDVTMVDNLVRNTVGFLSLSGPTSKNPLDSTTRRITLTRNLLAEQVGTPPYNPRRPGQHVVVSIVGPVQDVEITNSRIADYAANPNEAIRFAGPPTRRIRLENLVLKKGTYGVFGNGEGKSTWERFADESQSVWKNVTVLGANVSRYPRGTKASAGPTEGVDPARIRAKVANVVVPP
jgi:hypothetical protein